MLKTNSLLLTLLAFLSSHTLIDGSESNNSNNLTYAVAWKQTAAEYRALYRQGFNIARLRVEQALAKQSDTTAKPLAIVTDIDDTLLLPVEYWGHLIQNEKDFFDDSVWDEWIPKNRATTSPGSLAFLDFCHSNGIEIFYITSRDQGNNTFEYALKNLQAAGFPQATESNLSVLRETSNKQAIQDRISEIYDIILFLGDNLNDFRRKYYSKDVDERIGLMEEDKAKFGAEYILFPNPTDGHWIRAIYGESEPEASDKNREILKKSASRNAWEQ